MRNVTGPEPSSSRPRRGVMLISLLALALAAGACGPVNRGSAFASDFDDFLDGRENLADFNVAGYNNLPWSGTGAVTVTLVDDLDTDDMVEEIWAITHYEADPQVDYDLTVIFEAENASGDPAVASVRLEVPSPAPDAEGPREQIAERIEVSRDLVSLGEGETELDVQSYRRVLKSQRDATELAADLCEDESLLRQADQMTIDTWDGLDTSGSVTYLTVADCGDLPAVTEVLDRAGELGEVMSYTASFNSGNGSGTLTLVAPELFGNAELSALADSLDVDLVVN